MYSPRARGKSATAHLHLPPYDVCISFLCHLGQATLYKERDGRYYAVKFRTVRPGMFQAHPAPRSLTTCLTPRGGGRDAHVAPTPWRQYLLAPRLNSCGSDARRAKQSSSRSRSLRPPRPAAIAVDCTTQVGVPRPRADKAGAPDWPSSPPRKATRSTPRAPSRRDAPHRRLMRRDACRRSGGSWRTIDDTEECTLLTTRLSGRAPRRPSAAGGGRSRRRRGTRPRRRRPRRRWLFARQSRPHL